MRPSHWVALILFLVGILVFELGSRGLNEPDEGRYANIAQEVLEFDHPWWEPQIADVGHYDKPPLTYWISALGYEIFGLNEWGARLPSLLGAFCSLAGVGWLAFRLYGPRVAWLAMLVAGTLLQIWLWGRLLSCDMLLTGWCTLAIAAWAETRHRGGQWRWWTLQLIFWTLAGWTKATPALIPMGGLALYVFLVGKAEDRRALKLPLLLPLVVLFTLVWYAIILASHPGLQNFFFHRELAQRITGHLAGRAGPLYYYIPLCLLGWLPWWPLALVALWRGKESLRESAGRWKELLSPGFCIVATGFCVFSLIGSKHATYLLPFAPWAALEFSRLLERDRVLGRPQVVLSVAGISALIYLVGASLVPARQSSMGLHSSLHDVAAVLRAHHAQGVYSDHFWPSLEVYCGENVFFTDTAPEEVFEKADAPSEHFGFTHPEGRPHGWFVHYRKATAQPFARWLNDSRVPKIIIGDFIIGPIVPDAPAVAGVTGKASSVRRPFAD